MKAKQVCKLQENLAKEAIAYLMLLTCSLKTEYPIV